MLVCLTPEIYGLLTVHVSQFYVYSSSRIQAPFHDIIQMLLPSLLGSAQPT